MGRGAGHENHERTLKIKSIFGHRRTRKNTEKTRLL